MKINKITQLAVAAAVFAVSVSSQASLVYTGVVTDTGSGIGNVNTVLTLEADQRQRLPGGVLNPMYAMGTGAIVRVAPGTDDEVGDVKPGAVHNATYSFGDLNVTNTNQLEFIFNPVEPGNVGDNSIILNSLVLTIYTDAGAILWNSGPFAPINFPTSETGTGRSGHAFSLDALQATASQAFYGATNRIGLAASIADATGGPDTFFVRVLDDGEGPGTGIPEPGSVALLGLGVAGMAALRRRNRKA